MVGTWYLVLGVGWGEVFGVAWFGRGVSVLGFCLLLVHLRVACILMGIRSTGPFESCCRRCKISELCAVFLASDCLGLELFLEADWKRY